MRGLYKLLSIGLFSLPLIFGGCGRELNYNEPLTYNYKDSTYTVSRLEKEVKKLKLGILMLLDDSRIKSSLKKEGDLWITSENFKKIIVERGGNY